MSRFFGLQEGGAYVFKNGALRPIQAGWIMKEGSWQPVRLETPSNLGFGRPLGAEFFEGGGGLLGMIAPEEETPATGDKDDPEMPSS
jgi:hypothetical protein